MGLRFSKREPTSVVAIEVRSTVPYSASVSAAMLYDIEAAVEAGGRCSSVAGRVAGFRFDMGSLEGLKHFVKNIILRRRDVEVYAVHKGRRTGRIYVEDLHLEHLETLEHMEAIAMVQAYLDTYKSSAKLTAGGPPVTSPERPGAGIEGNVPEEDGPTGELGSSRSSNSGMDSR